MSLDDRIAGMSCREVLAALGDYVDGTLPAADRVAVEGHVGACGNCAAFGGTYGALVARLRDGLRPAPLPAAVADRLARRLTDE